MKPLIYDVIFTRIHARILIVLSSLAATVFALFGPYFQKLFVDALTGAPATLPMGMPAGPVALITLAFISVFVSQILFQASNYLGMSESVYMQGVFSQRIYKKTLDLRVDTMSSRPVGEIIQIYATDIPGSTILLEQTLTAGASTLFPLILAPFAISLIYDLPLFPTLILMALIAALNSFMAFRQSKFFYRFKQLAGDRIALVNEWIQNIRTIRILGWISYFEKNIFAKRQVETKNRVIMVTNGQVMNALSSSITFILNVVTLASLIYYSKRQVTSGELLALLWIVGVFLTRPFRQMPWFFTFAFDAWTSLARLESFLRVTNENSAANPNADHDSPGAGNNVLDADQTGDVALEVKNLHLAIGGKDILSDINLSVREGEFVAIVGEVGAGKSMLLLSLLGETGAQVDSYQIQGKNAATMSLHALRGHYAYVPQEGFIMSASLRENVAFLYDIEAERDNDVEESLRLAQFEIFKERVENGLATEIGERGVNLSGGQKQRVSLARVHFHKAPILLLDDCLSAVDVDTEERLFDQLLDGAWGERTRLLVTHRLSVLHRVDRIFFMQNGRIVDQGKFNELMSRSPLFREFTQSVEETAHVEA